jgi:hypothetical protein
LSSGVVRCHSLQSKTTPGGPTPNPVYKPPKAATVGTLGLMDILFGYLAHILHTD